MNTRTGRTGPRGRHPPRRLAYGARGRTLGEVVFETGMTGYQETL